MLLTNCERRGAGRGPASARLGQGEELGCLVMTPQRLTEGDVGTNTFSNVIGTSRRRMLHYLIFKRHLEILSDLKDPRGCNGGGYLPAYSGGRQQLGRAHRLATRLPKPPTEYLKKVYFDRRRLEPHQLK